MKAAVWFVLGVLASVVAEAVAVLYVKTQLDDRYDRRIAQAFAPDEITPPEWVNDAALEVRS